MDAVIIVQIQYTYIAAEFETGCSRTGDKMKWCSKGTCTLDIDCDFITGIWKALALWPIDIVSINKLRSETLSEVVLRGTHQFSTI